MPYMTHKLRERISDLRTRYGSCPDCGRPMRGYKDYVAHGSRHAYWAGKAGKAMRRKMGKTADSLRRSTRSNLERHRYVDEHGNRTWRWRTRPDVLSGPGSVSKRLREAQRHQDDHDRADYHRDRAAAHDQHAARHKERASGRGARPAWSRARARRHEAAAGRHRAREAGRRGRWAEVPSRAAPEPRPPAPERPAPAPRAKTRTAPARTAPAPARTAPVRTPSPPSPYGRLAPGATGNGHRPAPARTRSPR